MGFDRYSIIEDLLLGLTTPAASYWDNSIWVDPTIEPWPYDPDRANELLDDAGWVDTNGDGTRDKDGVELVLDYGSNQRQIRLDLQVVAQEQLAEIGVGMGLHNYESDLFFDQEGPAGAGELDIMEWSDTTYYPDPDWYYWLCSEIPTEENPEGANWQRICDEELDGLFQLQLTQSNPVERQETFHEISRIVYDEVYWLGLFQDPDLWGTNERLQNVKISGVTPFFNIAEWDLAAE
jgi:peptide/nickel transport system substrate-binding protein